LSCRLKELERLGAFDNNPDEAECDRPAECDCRNATKTSVPGLAINHPFAESALFQETNELRVYDLMILTGLPHQWRWARPLASKDIFQEREHFVSLR